MNKDVEQVLSQLVRDGFSVDRDRGGITLVAPNGERWKPSNNFKAVRAWAEKQKRASARRDRAERRDGGGVSDAHRHGSRMTSRADGVLSHWDRLNTEWKTLTVREMLYRLAKEGDDNAASALREMGG